MISRCTNSNHTNYARYGGPGIGIEDPRQSKFENFLADMGPKPSDGRRYDIHRLDDSRGYCKENYECLEHNEHARLHGLSQKLKAAMEVPV